MFKTTAVNRRVSSSHNLVWPRWTICSILAVPQEETVDSHKITSNMQWKTIGSLDPVDTLQSVRHVVIGPPREEVIQKEADGNYPTYLVINSQDLVVDTMVEVEEADAISSAGSSTINVKTTDTRRAEAIRVAISTLTTIIVAMTWLIWTCIVVTAMIDSLLSLPLPRTRMIGYLETSLALISLLVAITSQVEIRFQETPYPLAMNHPLHPPHLSLEEVEVRLVDTLVDGLTMAKRSFEMQ